MKRISIIFLQVVIIALGIGALVLLLLEPRVEGVNTHATTLYEIYFDDPFLMLVYAGAIPFFIALYQAIKLLGYSGRNQIFSLAAVTALRTIKYCALAIIGFVILEEIWIMLNHGNDDATGGVMMGVFITFGAIVVAAAAALFERTLQHAVDLKSENDLTI